MPTDFISLFVIAFVAAACPIAAKLIPHKLIPETVFLLVAGALLGPFMSGIIEPTESVNLLSDLGLAFLFLLAGYEIHPKSLTGAQGKRGLATWIISFIIALALMWIIPSFRSNTFELIAMAIVLTTTALGTIMPILKERGLTNTYVGDLILAYGTWGELCPILAMVLLLSSRAEWKTALILMAFIALCILAAVVPANAKKAGHIIFRFLSDNANTTSQTIMRTVVLLLVGLITLSALFDLDIVLGAFAAGFILHYIIPEGNRNMETKLDGLAYGFFIPVFFVVSGTKIDLTAVLNNPAALIGFIIMLLLLRAVPIFIALSFDKDTRGLSTHNRLTVALYCTTALPIIVAVTVVAVGAGAMNSEMASILVAAGAVTVFLMPLLASITYRVVDVQPIEAVKKICQSPRDIGSIIHDHVELERLLARQEIASRIAEKQKQHPAANLPQKGSLFHSQHALARKRALDEALNLAAQDMAVKTAATNDAIRNASKKRKDSMREFHTEIHKEYDEHRRRLAEIALREYCRRMAEIGRSTEEADAYLENIRLLAHTHSNTLSPLSCQDGEEKGKEKR